MIVSELIEELSKMPKEAEVWMESPTSGRLDLLESIRGDEKVVPTTVLLSSDID